MDNYKKLTRSIYFKQHKFISEEKKIFNRIFNIYKDQDYGLGENFYKNKIVLDVGCGNFGALISRLSKLKCREIHACDLGKSWIDPLKENLKDKKISLKNIFLKPGDATNLKYKQEMFDFVALNGVLLHLKNINEVKKAFKEATRVTKKNGYLFISCGVSGGLVQGIIFPALREYYKKNTEFKKLIDNLEVKDLKKIFNFISSVSKMNNGPKINPTFLENLFHKDYIVFLRNHIQAPFWLTNELNLKFIRQLYKDNGFKKLTRINKFVRRSDIRKYFAPLHFMRNYWFSKIMYGEGYVQFIGRK
jgi:ubiquinone/menaquinone biosynthesis C-methylase UbiE